MTPYRIGWIAAVAAAAMILVQIAGYSWFVIPVSESFRFPLWILVAIYAGLQFWIWRLTQQRLTLTDDEVVRWGDKLEQATPTILRLYAQHQPVKEIASTVEASHGIPPDITLRYIIALGKYGSPPPQTDSDALGPSPPSDDPASPEVT
ncbi:MAG: hypothetical protein CVU56_07930 [Deltaproteobacteria bacterium HGW-Deltaproteobacteria-14]|jgi:hypothetical protein|nr:MAG: hypothetical protein CVU56_07930 [Deltaproteobacteria bacterium HGW-Deltaproteobacteria-14]